MCGLEKIWIVGDNFSNNTFSAHYKFATGPSDSHQVRENPFYAFQNYEVCEFSNNSYDSLYRSMAGHIRNSLIKAVNEHNTLPKLIIVILDDDLIYGVSKKSDLDDHQQLHILTAWLMTEFEKAILAYKDMLPPRSKRSDYSHFLWIAPPTNCNFPLHNNDMRVYQGKCLSDIVKTKQNMSVLQMVKIWEHTDRNAFLQDAQRFTSDGLDKYWSSIDSAIRYWDVILSKKIIDKKCKMQDARHSGPQFHDKFHWHNSSGRQKRHFFH